MASSRAALDCNFLGSRWCPSHSRTQRHPTVCPRRAMADSYHYSSAFTLGFSGSRWRARVPRNTTAPPRTASYSDSDRPTRPACAASKVGCAGCHNVAGTGSSPRAADGTTGVGGAPQAADVAHPGGHMCRFNPPSPSCPDRTQTAAAWPRGWRRRARPQWPLPPPPCPPESRCCCRPGRG